MDEPVCPGCRELARQVAELKGQVVELTRKLEEALRAGKRQAAPFRKGPPKPQPKTPGRKSGEAHGAHGHRLPPTSDQVNEIHEANLPDDCPHCHGTLVEDEIVEQFQTDIPRKPVIRKFRVHVGHCEECGKRSQGRHPLQTSDAIGAAASQVGPDAQAAATILHTKHGLSHGKVANVFDALFGIKLTRGASAQINLRAAMRLEGDYQTILDDLRNAQRIAADETGWRMGGHPAWLHVWVGERSTAYHIDSHRSADALERVIGVDWSGTLSHDGYSTYDRFTEAIHQSCVAHVLRRAREMLDGAVRGAVHFPRQVITLFTEAVHQRNEHLRGRVTLEELQDQRDVFDDRLLALLTRPRLVAAHATFAKHMWNHFEQWFSFVFNPAVEATNWLAEQAIRPAVVNRKVWGGNRTPAGAKAQGVLMSVMETVRHTSRSVVDYVSESLRAFGNRMLMGPSLLLGR
jgi:transposase